MLELTPTDDLVKELMGRFDNCCIVANKNMSEPIAGRVMYWQCKDLTAGIGLLEILKQRMVRRVDKGSRPTDSF